jgi:ATP/maltotriose-dependent transcriptional regulator MalT
MNQSEPLADRLGVGMCVKKNKTVVFQNDECVRLCGDKTNTDCLHCTQEDLLEAKRKGARLRYKIYDDDVRVIVHHKKDNEEMTVLSSIDQSISDAMLGFVATPSLTKQEREVVISICEGYNNAEIQELLYISKATLKTHINHIYQKCPDIVAFRKQYLA